MQALTIIGAGPAGGSAALRALSLEQSVTIYEKSAFPRHKVCGEFLSPEAEQVFQTLGVWDQVQHARPARLTRVLLQFARSSKAWALEEPALSISRYTLDWLLLNQAIERGAKLIQESFEEAAEPRIVAHGRKLTAPKGRRLFGYKAHFSGPVDDTVAMYFFGRGYAGVSAIEGGFTNVCGLAPEDRLRACDFDLDTYTSKFVPLRRRISPLTRTMDWLVTGPLVFSTDVQPPSVEAEYRAGDALGFIDPFTGSGILSALETGRIAAESAAEGLRVEEHVARCRAALGRQYRFAGLARAAIESGWAERLLPFAPGSLLFRMTRPSIVS